MSPLQLLLVLVCIQQLFIQCITAENEQKIGVQSKSEHSFFIGQHDMHIEINIKLLKAATNASYTAIVTRQDCKYKYKILTLEALIFKIKDAIDDDVDKAEASYQIRVPVNNNNKDSLEFTIFISNYIEEEEYTFVCHLIKNPAIPQEYKVIDHLETQIYELRHKNKQLKKQIKQLKLNAKPVNIDHDVDADVSGVAPTIPSTSSLPKYSIIMWYRCNHIPIGYLLCDGTNKTPDLRGRFIIGADDTNYKFKEYGGNSEHNHYANMNVRVMENQILSSDENNSEYCSSNANKIDGTDDGVIGACDGHTHDINTNVDINDASHMPPYYVLCYIMKT